MFYINSAINPILYNTMSSRFFKIIIVILIDPCSSNIDLSVIQVPWALPKVFRLWQLFSETNLPHGINQVNNFLAIKLKCVERWSQFYSFAFRFSSSQDSWRKKGEDEEPIMLKLISKQTNQKPNWQTWKSKQTINTLQECKTVQTAQHWTLYFPKKQPNNSKGENRPGLHHSTSSSALVGRQPLCQVLLPCVRMGSDPLLPLFLLQPIVICSNPFAGRSAICQFPRRLQESASKNFDA